MNQEILTVSGNIVYLDKSTKHMYELNNKVRLIDVSSYLVSDSDEFIGFVCGIISQDHDLEQMYFDSFLKIACIENDHVEPVLNKLEKISEVFGVDFILSISLDKEELPASAQDKVIVSL